MRLDLTPSVPIPLGLTARLAHTRVDSSGDVHAGFAFDFIRNRAYEPFVAEQVCRYVAKPSETRFGDEPMAVVKVREIALRAGRLPNNTGSGRLRERSDPGPPNLL